GKEVSGNNVPMLEIRTFNRQTLVGRMPDADDEVVDEALEFCRTRLDKWRQLSVLDRLKIISETGKQLAEDASFDEIIPRTGWFSRKAAVVPDRLMTAQWMIKSEEYMNWACGDRRVKNNLIEGIGTVGIIVQSSMFQTGAYAIIDALRAGNSILVKLDSRDPYSEYLVAKTLAQAGAPVQIISVDTRNRPHIGRKLIDKLDKVVFMGNPLKIIEIAYGEALKQLQTTGGLPSEQIRELQQKLLIPAKVISYTAHLGGAYVDRETDLIPAVESVLHSFTSHYRACKRLVTAVIHPDIYDQFVVELQTRVEKLVVGEPSNPEADIVQCSQRYWDRFIKPYLEKSKGFGRSLYGEYDPFSPKIVELNLDRLGTSREKGYLGEEIMFPLLNIVKGDHHTAVLIADMMGQGSHDGRILEYSVFSEDDGIFKFFEHHGRAFNYHRNEPTTWGLGDVQAGRFRYHQRKILAVDLAGFK
ncbi:MAG: hypothetical protein C0407_11415, partial [Desulfobacca sp.]|nr:hypothetical protein [Desulfobacca sp.]